MNKLNETTLENIAAGDGIILITRGTKVHIVQAAINLDQFFHEHPRKFNAIKEHLP